MMTISAGTAIDGDQPLHASTKLLGNTLCQRQKHYLYFDRYVVTPNRRNPVVVKYSVQVESPRFPLQSETTAQLPRLGSSFALPPR